MTWPMTPIPNTPNPRNEVCLIQQPIDVEYLRLTYRQAVELHRVGCSARYLVELYRATLQADRIAARYPDALKEQMMRNARRIMDLHMKLIRQSHG